MNIDTSYLLSRVDKTSWPVAYFSHQTSIEALYAMMKTGFLPSTQVQYQKEVKDPLFQRIYFKIWFNDDLFKKLKDEMQYYFDNNLDEANAYNEDTLDINYFSAMTGFTHYILSSYSEANASLRDELNYLFYRYELNQEINDQHLHQLLEIYFSLGVDVDITDLNNKIKNGFERKGVILRSDNRIFEKYEGRFNIDGGALEVRCPDGIDKNYITQIDPQGPIERKIINSWLQGIDVPMGTFNIIE